MEESAATSTLLAIDDDQDILKVLKANLELHGFKLVTATSLTEARQVLESLQPDLIILDLMLPDGDGLEFCCSLKSIHPQLPIIMLTARDKVSDKVVGLELGADDYVVKPFETSELLARIKARLRSSPGGAPNPVIRAGELEVDLRNQTVSVNGQEIYLTAKEFQLLACLVENRNNLVTRDEIRKRLWRDSKIYSWSRVIDVHIQHLRQKIEKTPSRPRFIITVPGRGYRFAEE
ncbi:response regulator transcription factor [Desulfurivibrio alkaliphilus]|uniref:Two component transcriptional regulator, winged helix family n=1 Tax=Desulfurivibrio alkaliphilus (strain DSM 19089 / UNIQEM U267 / AHT2) TaxID=589865 RepID=D6Z393_DESAT|nr:response regulator transcription factor [Desulfurivibrio alkaliphilus]ADH86018.1 two component transcriptional regulator, winged helix family [Desulfurivibrio alkaliphilus AHT 2]